MPERLATCNLCRNFTVPWGDHIGPELMRAHQGSDCPGRERPGRERKGRSEFTGDQLEEIFHAALKAGDVQGVEAALTVMVGVDMHRAIRLYDLLKRALVIADFLKPTPPEVLPNGD